MNTTPRSFSGTHEFRPGCVAVLIQNVWAELGLDQPVAGENFAARVTAYVNAGQCPRCEDDIADEVPAGSRVTQCRCIPICPACGVDEAYQPGLGRRLSPVWEWPISKGHRTRRLRKAEALTSATSAIIAGDTLITEDGAQALRLRSDPGGWAEFGQGDETGDQR